MVGNVTGVTAELARTQATTATQALPAPADTTGKTSSPVGQKLPAPEVVAPVVDVARAIERLNELSKGSQRNLRFHVDEATGRTVITVVNAETDEIIRQIPPDELLALSRSLDALRGSINVFA